MKTWQKQGNGGSSEKPVWMWYNVESYPYSVGAHMWDTDKAKYFQNVDYEHKIHNQQEYDVTEWKTIRADEVGITNYLDDPTWLSRNNFYTLDYNYTLVYDRAIKLWDKDTQQFAPGTVKGHLYMIYRIIRVERGHSRPTDGYNLIQYSTFYPAEEHNAWLMYCFNYAKIPGYSVGRTQYRYRNMYKASGGEASSEAQIIGGAFPGVGPRSNKVLTLTAYETKSEASFTKILDLQHFTNGKNYSVRGTDYINLLGIYYTSYVNPKTHERETRPIDIPGQIICAGFNKYIVGVGDDDTDKWNDTDYTYYLQAITVLGA